jgi:hypothetical protein
MFKYESFLSGAQYNYLFSSQFTGLMLSGSGSNPGSCGLSMRGAQGCLVDNVFISNLAIIGANIEGPSIGTIWIEGIARGPGLFWGGGGQAKYICVEHTNPTNQTDSTSEPYPYIHIEGLYGFDVGLITCEPPAAVDGQQFVRINAAGVVIGQVAVGTYGLPTGTGGVAVRITGYSNAVNIGCIRGVGDAYHSPGTLVLDDSGDSPAGAGNPFYYNVFGGGYAHHTYKELGRKYDNNNWFGHNRFHAPQNGTAMDLGGNVSAIGNRFGSLDFFYDSTLTYRITPVVNTDHDWRLEFRDNADTVMARFYPSKLLQVPCGVQSDFGYAIKEGSANPTALDIPAGFKQTWRNTTTGEVRDWTNIGGTLLKSAAYT